MQNGEELKEILIKNLKKISEDEEFLLSVINHVRHIDDRKKLIEYLESGNEVTYEEVILLALNLYEQRYE